MSTHNYSADQVILVWKGIDHGDGLAQGSFISETEGAGGWANKSNARGTKATRVFNPEKMGTVDILVDQESLLHQQLLAVYELDSKPGTRSQVGPLIMTDKSTGEEVKWQNAYLAKRPNVTRSVEGGTVTWTYNYERKEQKALTTLASTVGD